MDIYGTTSIGSQVEKSIDEMNEFETLSLKGTYGFQWHPTRTLS